MVALTRHASKDNVCVAAAVSWSPAETEDAVT